MVSGTTHFKEPPKNKKKTRQNGDVGKMCVFEPAQKCKNNWDCAVYYDCGTFCCLSHFHRKFETDSVRGKLIFHA